MSGDPTTLDNFVVLTGGLGNQLFQYAAALRSSEGRNLTLIDTLGRPRKSNLNHAELFDFELPSEIRNISINSSSGFLTKVFGFVIHNSVKPREYLFSELMRKIYNNAASLVFSLVLRKRVALISPRGVGFSNLTKSSKSEIFVGYFQSFRWASRSDIRERLLSMNPINPSKLLDSLKAEAEKETPLMVHVRRGDYLNEDKFGLLGNEYYHRAISNVLLERNFNSIWIFTDSQEDMSFVIPPNSNLPFRVIPNLNLTSVETLEAMRYCYGYVIGNSTFSWWGAFLSYRSDAPVVAPSPWFIGLEEPVDLTPPEWQRVNRF